MSFVSGTNILTLGNNNNTTVNIGTTATNPTINIGVSGDDNPVLIRGLDPLISSTTGFFASYRNINSGFNSTQNSYYMLPFSTSQNLLIQWGYVPEGNANDTITFQLRYNNNNSNPYMFVTRYNDGSNDTPVIVASSLSTTSFVIDSAVGDPNKCSYNWLAIGLINK